MATLGDRRAAQQWPIPSHISYIGIWDRQLGVALLDWGSRRCSSLGRGTWNVEREASSCLSVCPSRVSSLKSRVEPQTSRANKKESRKLTDPGRDLSLVLHIDSTHTCKGKTKRRQWVKWPQMSSKLLLIELLMHKSMQNDIIVVGSQRWNLFPKHSVQLVRLPLRRYICIAYIYARHLSIYANTRLQLKSHQSSPLNWSRNGSDSTAVEVKLSISCGLDWFIYR